MEQEALTSVYEFENQEWLDSLDFIIHHESAEHVREILDKLHQKAQHNGIDTGTQLKRQAFPLSASSPGARLLAVSYGFHGAEHNSSDLFGYRPVAHHTSHPTLSETIMEAADALYGHSTHIYRPKKS